MDSEKPEPRSTNFDSDAEDGELTSSPIASTNGEPRIVPADIMKGTERDCGEFIMDRTESIEVNDNDVSSQESSQSDAGSAWLSQITAGLLDDVDHVQPEEPEEPPKKRSRAACFNCGGPHQLNQCTEPKDQKRIREAANEFKERRRMQETGRYTDEQKKEGESEFRPGRISTALREALGIGSDDIPEWVYRMRKMGFSKGYPPAYLKQAIISEKKAGAILQFHLCDGDGDQEIKTPDDEGRETPPPKLDGNKIHFYMGFNKTYRSLRDKEGNFRIPPWDDYIRFHQDELTRKYWDERDRKRSERKDRQRRKKDEAEKNKKELLEENDIVVLDTCGSFEEGADCMVIDPAKEDEKKDAEETDRPVTPVNSPQEPSTSTTPKGTTISTISGTPVMVRKNQEGQDVHNSLPALEAFSKGITPFEAKEEVTGNRGFMKQMMASIRKYTGK